MIDGYPEYMMKSIKLVEKKREENMSKPVKPMSMNAREEALSKYHPDYMQGTKRELKVGIDKGTILYNGIVDLLEARTVIDPKDVDLTKVDYDVDLLIIGGGGAGTVAALFAYESGVPLDKILIVTKLRHGDANSIMAQGGIQAADRPEDNPALHYLDIYGGGHFTNKPELARSLALDAPGIINWHQELGVMYDRQDDGEFQELSGGGTCRNRMHSAKDYTGMELLRNIRDESRTKDYLYGENLATRYFGPYETKIIYEPTDEPTLTTGFGINSEEVISFADIPKFTFSRDVSAGYHPKPGDAIITLWNNRAYEIADIGEEEKIFQLKKMVWGFALRPYRFSDESESAREISRFTRKPTDPNLIKDTTTEPLSAFGDNEDIEDESDDIFNYGTDYDTNIYGY